MEELRRLSKDELSKILMAEDRSEMSADEIIDRIGLCLKPEVRKRRTDELRLHILMMQGGWKDSPSRIRYVQALTDSELGSLSLSIVIGRADRRIRKTRDTLHQMGHILDPAAGHALDGSGIADDGLMHRVSDSKGEAAFAESFDSKKWSKPTGVV